MRFVKVNDGAEEEEQIVIFIHGFRHEWLPGKSNRRTENHSRYYIDRIKSANLKGQVFLGQWDSAGLKLPPWLSTALKITKRIPNKGALLAAAIEYGLSKGLDFKIVERQAKKEGENLLWQMKRKFADSKGKKIYLIGHSLGSLVIHRSLTTRHWEKVPELELADVFYLGSAVPVLKPLRDAKKNWKELLGSIKGQLFNCYSRRDIVLRMPPDTRTRVGNGRINSAGLSDGLKYFPRITDLSFTGKRYGHMDYVEKLGPTLRRVKDECETELELG